MTPIEKLIKELEAMKIPSYNEKEFCDGVKFSVDTLLDYTKKILPTEAEHTKQVGTGFAEWADNNYYRMGNTDKWSESPNWEVAITKTTSELWDEYILTLQNKKG